MKKTFIKPLAKTVAMQTQNMILAGSSLTLGTLKEGEYSPSGAEAKRGGTFTSGDLLLDI